MPPSTPPSTIRGREPGHGIGRWLAWLVTRRPGRVLAVALVVTALFIPALRRLKLDTDIVDLFPRNSSEAQAFARFTRSFTSDQQLVVLLECADPDVLSRFADQLGPALQQSPLFGDVQSRIRAESALFFRDHLLQLLGDDEIAAIENMSTPAKLDRQARRLRGLLTAPGGSALAPLLEADPLELLPRLRGRLQHGLPFDVESGYFRSEDKRSLLILARPKSSAFDIEASRAVIEEARRIAGSLGAEVEPRSWADAPGPRVRVGFTGSSAYALYYRDWLHRDMTLSTTLSAVSVLLLFALFFRAVAVLPLVAAPLGLGLLWTTCAAALLFGRMSAVSLSFGTVLLSIGIDLPIQIYNRLREELSRAPEDPIGALQATIAALAGPALMATLGPAAVFLSCALSDYRGLVELGQLAAIGLMLNFVAMIVVFPALLAQLPPRWWARGARAASSQTLGRLGGWAARRPWRMLIATAVLLLLAIPGALHLRFDHRIISLQPPHMPPVAVQNEIETKFGDRSRMIVVLIEDADRDRALDRAGAWLDEAERLRRAGLLVGYESPAALLPSKRVALAHRARLEALDSKRMAQDFKAVLADAGFQPKAFSGFLQQLAEPGPALTFEALPAAARDLVARGIHDGPDGRVIATFLYPSTKPQARVAIEKFAAGPVGGALTGKLLLEEALYRVVVADTVRVTVASALGVALLLALYYRRWAPWIAVMLPLLLAWTLFAATLAVLELPINLYNLLAVPLVIGYGIDDHVFMIHRWESGASASEMLATTGRAIVLTSLSTMAGFIGLAVARFDGLRLFGLSGALAVALCLFAAGAVLPALLTVLYKRDTP